MNAAPRLGIVLPPKESFAPFSAGAVAEVARLLAAPDSLVVGSPPAGPPFAAPPFRPVRPGWWPPGPSSVRYAAAAVAALRGFGPGSVDVHNRPDVAAAVARRMSGVPVSLMLHNDPQGMREARSPAGRAGLLKDVAAVFCVSDWVRDRFLDGVPEPLGARVHVIGNPIDLSALPVPAAREKLILFAGRAVADKGADVFVEACAQVLPALEGWRAELIGADRFRPDSPETPFLRALRPRAAAAGVALVGHRPRSEVQARMARAAIVAVPSRWEEPFGLVALEAMAAGAALVATGGGGLGALTEGVAWRIPPGDPAALAEALRTLADDPDRREAMGEAGRVRAREYDAPTIAARLAALRPAA